jgi:ABC-type multidrug transport system fused ATPase/permease subunit
VVNLFEVEGTSLRHTRAFNPLVSHSRQQVKWDSIHQRTALTFSSLERIKGYIDIEHEKPATDGGKPPAYWPASGDLRVENLSARYSKDGPRVLHNISFHIKSGERVGIGRYFTFIFICTSHCIVGRTGSGKVLCSL